eukprot:CAMPEP_0182600432 /NCGR_PEP_ID=MMETSP1324-20130603/90977_1 /TAXON_ID=236786 /ORGANISM="Florenciella sp., Strain RCC1587" /LENGTH=95 /DNA_ID=CAMNT_0024818339 /DNA_START=909 /DNA_END=1196 /DNA_ORIENTATION=+
MLTRLGCHANVNHIVRRLGGVALIPISLKEQQPPRVQVMRLAVLLHVLGAPLHELTNVLDAHHQPTGARIGGRGAAALPNAAAAAAAAALSLLLL